MAGFSSTGGGGAGGASVLGTKPLGASGPAPPRWATPGRLLALFCIMCLFIYMDRGAGVPGTRAKDWQVHLHGTGCGGILRMPTPAAAVFPCPQA